MAAAPAESTCSHSGILTCGAARLTTAITSGARASRLALGFGLLGLGVGIFGAERRGDRVAGGEPRVALEDDEAPGRELAVVGHARGDGQQRFDLRRRRTGAGQLDRLDGAAGFEQFQGVGHDFDPQISA